MMKYNREQIKELLLTDYLDGQLDDSTKNYIDLCLEKDLELKSFFESVCKMTDEPFRNVSNRFV